MQQELHRKLYRYARLADARKRIDRELATLRDELLNALADGEYVVRRGSWIAIATIATQTRKVYDVKQLPPEILATITQQQEVRVVNTRIVRAG